MKQKHIVAAALVTLTALNGCGTKGPSLVESETGGEVLPAALGEDRTVDIDMTIPGVLSVPPREGPSDPRPPIQRLVGVPPDLSVATRRDHDLVEAALESCMNSRGFTYFRSSFNDVTSAQVPDQNESYFVGLTDAQQKAYSLARWGDSPLEISDLSCESSARNQVYPLNALMAEYNESVAELYQSQEIRNFTDARDECLEQSTGAGTGSPTNDMIIMCGDSSGLSQAIENAMEEFELSFIREHELYFVSFLNNLADLDK